MEQFIVDSGALLAMVDSSDKYHNAAAIFAREHASATYYLPELLFSETMTLVKARLGALPAVELGNRLRQSAIFKVVELNTASREQTWQIFSRYTDKAWSYADCAILAFALQVQVYHVFSFDRHVSQMAELERVPA